MTTHSNDTHKIIKQLEEGVTKLYESERYKEYLRTMSKFYNYSAPNCVLILNQCPEASYVAGYKTWQTNFERKVKKGETGIQILAPVKKQKEILVPRVDKSTGTPVLNEYGKQIQDRETIRTTSFRVTHVYDISQTEGKELPTIVTQLTNDVTNFDSVVDALRDASPVPIDFEPLNKANGYYSHTKKCIVVKDSLPEEQKIKTIIHEMAHATMHDSERNKSLPDSRTREVQAESVAYIVCQHFGVDSSDYSFGYIGAWSSDKDMKELKSSLTQIQKTSNYLISNIEMQLTKRNLIVNTRKEEPSCKKENQKKNYKSDTMTL